jgi:hypothetical protein
LIAGYCSNWISKALAREKKGETHGSAADTKLGALRSSRWSGRSVDEVGQLLRVLGLVLVFAGHCCKTTRLTRPRDCDRRLSF